VRSSFNTMVPFASQLTKSVSSTAAARGYIRTIMGRRARFPLWESTDFNVSKEEGWLLDREEAVRRWRTVRRARVYTAGNRLLQGGAADYLKMALKKAIDAGVFEVLGAPHMLVHDEIDISVPRTPEGQAALRLLHKCMETAIPLKIPVLAECGIGKNWAEAH
jgi:DNA polymerase I-like protein with 3'-5' exonuclease and polymerase domains